MLSQNQIHKTNKYLVFHNRQNKTQYDAPIFNQITELVRVNIANSLGNYY